MASISILTVFTVFWKIQAVIKWAITFISDWSKRARNLALSSAFRLMEYRWTAGSIFGFLPVFLICFLFFSSIIIHFNFTQTSDFGAVSSPLQGQVLLRYGNLFRGPQEITCSEQGFRKIRFKNGLELAGKTHRFRLQSSIRLFEKQLLTITPNKANKRQIVPPLYALGLLLFSLYMVSWLIGYILN